MFERTSQSHTPSAFEFEPVTGDYLVYYYPADLPEDPGKDAAEMERSMWSYLESVIIGDNEAT